MVLISSASTALPSKNVILIRRACSAYSVNIAGTAMRDIITHNALLEYLIEVVILWTGITSAAVLALEASKRTYFAGDWLEWLVS